MIKTIIKRDGRYENFNPEKVNGWGIWAANELGDSVDWGTIVLDTVSVLPETCTTSDLQDTLIDTCINQKTFEYNRMAGRLYWPAWDKEVRGHVRSTVKQLHDKLAAIGIMENLAYSDEEYTKIESIIDHNLNLGYTHYQLYHLRYKYALRDKIKGVEYETPQFIFMRMAMALAEKSETKMLDVEKYYYYFSHNIINAPTPNYVNLGTKKKGFASCCVYDTLDTAKSLATGDHIAFMMTVMSAGIGSHIHTRSMGDSVAGGTIEHQGKLPYYRSLDGAVHANLQNGRGGAVTAYYNFFDREVKEIQALKNPMTPTQRQIRGLDYAMNVNTFFAKKVQANEDIALFSMQDAPALYEAFYGKDQSEFERLYNEFVDSGNVKKFVPARNIILGALTEAYDTGRHYLCNIDLMNHHTPFKDKITGSNLCLEIALATHGYKDITELYSTSDNVQGEIGLCSLAALVVPNIKTDLEYSEAAYYALKMIDTCIEIEDYEFPHLEKTAKARRSAGVGVIGLAHWLANKKLSYTSQDGLNEIHTVMETHYWHLANASLKLAKERGLAEWMYKTKWPDGWLPIDTYTKAVDSLVTVKNFRDWESLRNAIVENGGIRNTVLVAHMPCETSSIASGTTNGVYPIRQLALKKTNNNMVTNWVAPDSSSIGRYYDIAWKIKPDDMMKVYGIIQKFTDQAISADVWDDLSDNANLSANDLLRNYLIMVKYGVKTRYYTNTKTTKDIDLSANACASGSCTL